jgi:hypothetical protein
MKSPSSKKKISPRYLSWFLNFQNAPLMIWRHWRFPRGLGEHILENYHLLEIIYWISSRSSFFLLIYCVNSWFLLVHCSRIQCVFQNCSKTIRAPQRNSKICLRPLNMACLFTEVYGDHFKIVLESIKLQFWRHLQYLLVLMYCFHLNRLENCNEDSSTETHLKKSKTKTVYVFVKHLHSISCPNPLKVHLRSPFQLF